MMTSFRQWIICLILASIGQFGMAQTGNINNINTDNGNTTPGPGNNPYLKGQKGSWRVKRTHAFLVNRSATRSGDIPNLRKDGVFESFSTFWNIPSGNSSDWLSSPTNWTTTNEVTKYSPHGQEVEDKDALGIFSTVQYGYNGFLVILVSANSQYQEAGFDGFEDYGFSTCTDDHFNFGGSAYLVTPDEFHTGRKSIRVSPGATVSMTRKINICLPPEPVTVVSVVPK